MKNQDLPRLLRALASSAKAKECKTYIILETAADELEKLSKLENPARDAVAGHDVVISGGGWSRHVEEPLWALRKALRQL